MMLRYLEEREAADRITQALERVLVANGVGTRDFGGQATTTEFTDAIIKELES